MCAWTNGARVDVTDCTVLWKVFNCRLTKGSTSASHQSLLHTISTIVHQDAYSAYSPPHEITVVFQTFSSCTSCIPSRFSCTSRAVGKRRKLWQFCFLRFYFGSQNLIIIICDWNNHSWNGVRVCVYKNICTHSSHASPDQFWLGHKTGLWKVFMLVSTFWPVKGDWIYG